MLLSPIRYHKTPWGDRESSGAALLPGLCSFFLLASITGCDAQIEFTLPNDVVELTSQNLQHEVFEPGQVVLVDFWAPWCVPCIAMAPDVAQVARDFSGRATVAKLNIDDYPDIAETFAVSRVPTVLILRSGELVKRRSGAQTHADMEKLLRSVLSKSGSFVE